MQEYIKEGRLRILAKPNAKKTEITGYDEERDAVKISIKAPPEDNKANRELLKFVQKTLHKKAEFVSGMTSKLKIIRILG